MNERDDAVLEFPALLHAELRRAFGAEEYRRLCFSFELDDSILGGSVRVRVTDYTTRKQLPLQISQSNVWSFSGPPIELARYHAQEIVRAWRNGGKS